jgi:PAS domain S-box-containing protein
MKPKDFFAEDEKERVARTIQEVFTKGKSQIEVSLDTKKNSKIPHYFTGLRMLMDDKKYLLGIGIDISGQKRAEEALRDSEKRYRAVVEDISAMICRFLPDGTLTFTNGSYNDFFNKKPEKLIGQNFFQFIPEEERERVREHFLSLDIERPMATYEHQVIAPDGKIQWQEWTDRALFDEQWHVVEYQSIGRDITEVKLAQEEKAKVQKQLQQAQKMEAIGTLAGGIAHDFNNILGAIIGYAGMMEMFDVPEESPLRVRIKEVLKGANRAKDLVKQILTFSRQTEQKRQPTQLNYIVKEALKFLRASLPTTIEIRQNIEDEEIIAMVDPTQIHQILMNLCTNAGHAMLETGGRLTVELSALNLSAQSAERLLGLKPGPHLKLTVSDTGHGMTSEIMERIFDPFFTTKKPGEGTGMGLAVVHGIIKSHEGVITVDSELGKGTIFQILLPRIEMRELESATETALSMPTGTERILFIDDEQSLVTLVKEILRRLGYEVVTKTSSREALELFRSQPEGFDLVITDQTMPYMTGIELVREIMQIRSDIPTILCTGYSETATPEKVEAAGVRELILKPLEPFSFAQTVRKVLDQRIDD